GPSPSGGGYLSGNGGQLAPAQEIHLALVGEVLLGSEAPEQLGGGGRQGIGVAETQFLLGDEGAVDQHLPGIGHLEQLHQVFDAVLQGQIGTPAAALGGSEGGDGEA